MGRSQAVDTSTILVSSPNPKLAQVEAARGQTQAARLAREPAWENPGHGASPRDPEKSLNLPCAPRTASTQELVWQSDARQAATEQMKALGYVRGTKVHSLGAYKGCNVACNKHSPCYKLRGVVTRGLVTPELVTRVVTAGDCL